MPRAIPTILTSTNGLRAVSDQQSVTGTVFSETTLITPNPETALHTWEVQGTAVAAVRANGSLWTNILGSAPVSPVAGDIWIANNGLANVLEFFNGTSVVTLTSTTGQTLSLTAGAGLVAGFALQVTSGGTAQYSNTTIDSARQYQVVGVAVATVSMGNPVTVATIGDLVTLSDWTAVTGAASLVVGKPYVLSDTPGKLQTTVPSSGVLSRVGLAVSATQLLVQPDLIVLPA
jgi:hypothetical protein